MTKNEEFEKLAGCEGFDLHQWTPGCYSDEKTAGAFEGYQLRQPEIDVLKAELEKLRKDADRYRYWRATTNAITNSKGERIDTSNASPEQFDFITDELIVEAARKEPK
jgi:exonuclease III